MNYIKNPAKIEEKSFEIIQQIIDDIRPDYTFQNKLEEAIIKRAIHTTADFDYLDSLVFQQDAIAKSFMFFKIKELFSRIRIWHLVELINDF